MFRYTIIVEKAGSNYSAYCPDLPGCIATGATVDETIERMKKAIEFHIDGLKKEGSEIPKPSVKAKSIGVVV
ncbi:MAG: type II toxin-antitoxin system HicB family antitoxin [Methanomicrobia archaeon]|nr:type II toxin-antitoxin system HicB family antitoxin [Methanomicrobia archaeon]